MGEWVTLADGSKLFCPYPLEQRPLLRREQMVAMTSGITEHVGWSDGGAHDN